MSKIETMTKISCQNISAKSGPSDADSCLGGRKLTVVVFFSGVSNSVKTFSKAHQMINFVQNRNFSAGAVTVSNRKI